MLSLHIAVVGPDLAAASADSRSHRLRGITWPPVPGFTWPPAPGY